MLLECDDADSRLANHSDFTTKLRGTKPRVQLGSNAMKVTMNVTLGEFQLKGDGFDFIAKSWR